MANYFPNVHRDRGYTRIESIAGLRDRDVIALLYTGQRPNGFSAELVCVRDGKGPEALASRLLVAGAWVCKVMAELAPTIGPVDVDGLVVDVDPLALGSPEGIEGAPVIR